MNVNVMPVKVFLLKWFVNKILTPKFIIRLGVPTETLKKGILKNSYVLHALMFWEDTFWEEILVQRWLTAQNFWEVWNCLSPGFLENRASEGKLLMLYWGERCNSKSARVRGQGKRGREGGGAFITELHEKHSLVILYLWRVLMVLVQLRTVLVEGRVWNLSADTSCLLMSLVQVYSRGHELPCTLGCVAREAAIGN